MAKKKFSILLVLCLLVSIFADMGSMIKVQAASPAPTVKKVTLYVGYEDYSIKMKDLGKGSKITYTSSDKKIATVTSKGVISPVAAGNATITVSVAQSGKTYKSTIAVTVKKPYVYITNKITQIAPGETYKFTGKTCGLKNTAVTWASSNKKVATINAKTGEMKAIAEGTVKITFKDKTSGKGSMCKVEIKQVDKNTLISAYRDYLNKQKFNSSSYRFIYLDGDDLPECVANGSEGTYVLSYKNGNVVSYLCSELSESREAGLYYIERSGFLRSNRGDWSAGYSSSSDTRIKLQKDFQTICYEDFWSDEFNSSESYYISGRSKVSKQEYEKYLKSLGYDESKEKTLIQGEYWDAHGIDFHSTLEQAYSAVVKWTPTPKPTALKPSTPQKVPTQNNGRGKTVFR